MFGEVSNALSNNPTIILASLVFVSVYYLWNRNQRLKSLPPGPRPLPFLGNILQIASSDQLGTFRKLREKYGDLVTLHAGSFTIVLVSGYDTLRELFIKRGDLTSDRPKTFFFTKVTLGEGIASRSGPEWKRHRTFAIGALRDFGFGKKSLEGKIIEELEVYFQVLEKQYAKPMDMNECIHTSVANIICSIVFGKRFEHGDPAFVELMTLINENFALAGPAGILNLIPILRYLPGDPAGHKQVLGNTAKIMTFLCDLIAIHEKEYDEENTKDFIDAYLKEMKSKEGLDSSFTSSQLMNTIADLFLAGMETTTTSLLWTLLYFLHYPEVQERCHEDVKRVVGEGRFPSLSDRPRLPYIEAVIAEVLRCGNIVPLGVPHATSEDVAFRGYVIPKGTMLFTNIYSVLTDPELFPNPGVFDPSRFIDAEGKLHGTERVITFFLGRRMCMGEALARNELFLFLASMVQRVQFKPEDPGNLPSLKGNLGITYKPGAFKCRIERRI